MDKAIHIQRGREHIIGRPWPLNLMVVFGIDPDDDLSKDFVDYEFNHNLLNLFFNGVISLNFINKHGTQDQLYYACKYMNNRSDQDWLREF